MARITKASLEEFAKEIAALEAAEATILSTEEMDRYSGGRYGAYTSLGTSQSDHEAHALAELEHDLLSTEVGSTIQKTGDESTGLYHTLMPMSMDTQLSNDKKRGKQKSTDISEVMHSGGYEVGYRAGVSKNLWDDFLLWSGIILESGCATDPYTGITDYNLLQHAHGKAEGYKDGLEMKRKMEEKEKGGQKK